MASGYLARRNELAQQKGFTSYGQQRNYRRLAREALAETGVETGNTKREVQAIDRLAVLIRNVRETGGTQLSQAELYDYMDRVFSDIVDPDDFYDDSDIWATVRQFYQKRGGR